MTTLTGTLRDTGGNPITGSLWLEISQPGTSGGILVTPLQPSCFTLTAGQISGPGAPPYTVYGNDTIVPSVTFYRLTAFDTSGGQVLRLNILVTGATCDLGALTIAPTQSWVAPPSYSIPVAGDATGTTQNVLVERIRGKAVGPLPWTPGHVLTVQADQSLAFAPGGIGDGNKVDVTVSGSGSTFTINPSVVSYAKIQNVSATDRLLGRATAGAGVIEEVPLTGAGRALLAAIDAAAQRSVLGLGAAALLATPITVPNGGTGLTTLTAGRIPFGAGTSALASSASLVWDEMNKRLGIGTSVPDESIHVYRNSGTRACVQIQADNVAGTYAALKLDCTSKTSQWLLTAGNTINGFEIRDSNAGQTRLAIDNTTGAVTVQQGLTVASPGTVRAQIQDDGGAVIDVKAHGAVGGGSGDDSAAFTAAITALPANGGTILIPPGTYRIASGLMTGTKRVLFRGAGGLSDLGGVRPPATTILKAATLNGPAITLAGMGAGARDLCVSGELGNGGDGILFAANGCWVSDSSVSKQGGVGINIGDGGATNCNSWSLSHVLISENVSHGLSISGSTPDANAGTGIAVRALQNGGDGIRAGKSLLNTFVSPCCEGNTGIGFRVMTGSSYYTVVGGDFEGNVAGQLVIESGATYHTILGVLDSQLLDSGAATTIISTAQAKVLSLIVRGADISTSFAGATIRDGAAERLKVGYADASAPFSGLTAAQMLAATVESAGGLILATRGDAQAGVGIYTSPDAGVTGLVKRLGIDGGGLHNFFSPTALHYGALTLANGLNSNVAAPNFGFVRIVGPTGAFSLGGLTGGSDGKMTILLNSVAQAMTIVNEDASSTAANRITTLTGANVVLRAGTSAATLIYDPVATRWVLLSSN